MCFSFSVLKPLFSLCLCDLIFSRWRHHENLHEFMEKKLLIKFCSVHPFRIIASGLFLVRANRKITNGIRGGIAQQCQTILLEFNSMLLALHIQLSISNRNSSGLQTPRLRIFSALLKNYLDHLIKWRTVYGFYEFYKSE